MPDEKRPEEPEQQPFAPTPQEQPTSRMERTDQDHEMDRFSRSGLQRFKARQGIIAVLFAAVVLALATGGSLHKQELEMHPGLGRDLVAAVAVPSSNAAKSLPIQKVANHMTDWIHPDPPIGTAGAFTNASAVTSYNGVPPVQISNFDPQALGKAGPAKRRLRSMLVTGDSMSTPLDEKLGDDLQPDGVDVHEDPHLGTTISQSIIVNWGALAVSQVKRWHPQAVVMFIGANDSFAMTGPNGKQVNCCSLEWATIYAQRVRQLMNTFRQNGVARVYWLLLPAYRQADREATAKVINGAFQVAAEPWANQVRIVNTIPTLTPGGKYRDSMKVNGQPTIVRQSDGVHLNDAGAQVAAKLVLSYVKQDFTW